MKNEINIAIIGTPNCGKTTLFNYLTRSKHKIGNYPGVTVDIKEGFLKKKCQKYSIIDLPGVYSLSSFSMEEKITREYLFKKKPDLIINVLDASNIERNLFLTTQLMELGIPVLLVCNKTDFSKEYDIKVDEKKLSSFFETKVFLTVASKNIGIKELKEEIFKSFKNNGSKGAYVKFSKDIEKKIEKILKRVPTRWHAIKILEKDPYVEDELNIKSSFKENYEEQIAYQRHNFLKNLLKNTEFFEKKRTKSDCIDKILLNKFFGLPIFLFIMFLVFQFTFILGAYPSDWLKIFFSKISFWLSNFWGYEGFFKILLIDGVVKGVGSVLVYLPNIVILFFALAFLEESGYMARAAFLMDKIMHKIGLHGKSFIPMLIGFGCSVPAIMSSRILSNKRDRFTTILVIPFICCSAKLAVFSLIIPAFFSPFLGGVILFSLYLFGVFLAVIFIKILRKTFFKGENIPFIMEMPFYRFPSIFHVFRDAANKGWLYIKRAGTIILFFSVIFCFLSYFPLKKNNTKEYVSKEVLENSYMGRIGKKMEPFLKPLGFDWRMNTALIGGFFAKEVFISQLNIIFSSKEDLEKDSSNRSSFLRKELKKNYSLPSIFSVLVFILISAPCFATVVMIKKETRSMFYTIFQTIFLLFLAYGLSFLVYRIGDIFV